MEVALARSFQSALESGQNAERAVVEELRLAGGSVGHGKKIVVKKHCKNTGHVETPDAVGLFAIEIKERSLSFTDPDSYPYPTVFVDDLRGMGMESYTNLIYILRSKPTKAWVWLTILDRNEEWQESVTFDRGRGHAVPVLVAPKSALRPASQLIQLLYPQHYLDLVDGNTDGFVSGGGATEERERYVAKTHPDVGGRAAKAPPKTRKHMG
jgi:hypothetical protein